MPKLIKDGAEAQDPWNYLDDDNTGSADFKGGKWVLPLTLFKELATALPAAVEAWGISIESTDEINELAPFLDHVTLVVLKFFAFTDGRGFSQARILRDQLDYEGEIRARGAFMLDQIFYLSRCGINSFLLSDDTELETAIARLSDFSDSYQASCDEPQPLFRRRI